MPLSESRILYIDDDEGLCRLARRHLERQGAHLTYALTGAAGIDLARAQHFDLVALDHFMPGQDGLETLQHIMALPSPPAVIYVTGSDESGIAVAALKAGAVDYVVKSVGEDFYDLLISTMQQALEALRLRREKEAVERALRETNAQLETLLDEMNHRIANSLQMVSALVSLQARRAQGEEAKLILQDVRHRIHAVSRVHRQLYTGHSVTQINMADYIHGLAKDLARTYATDTVLRGVVAEADAVDMPASTAVTLGVLINELVSNACKYAYPEGHSGEVRIRFTAWGEGCFRLEVEDDGVGVVHDAPPLGTGLGSQIVQAMATALGAQHWRENTDHGLRVVVTRDQAEQG